MSDSPPDARVTPWWTALVFGVLAAVVIKRPSVFQRDTSTTEPAKRALSSKLAQGGGRGRAAESPSDLPARGWVDILKRVYAEFGNDRVLAVAASVTFYALLAIFPAIVALVSLYGLFADPNTISEHLNAITGFVPGGAMDVIGEQVKRIASKPKGSLGLGFFFGLGVALWSANAGMKAMFDALNIVYDEKEKRGFVLLNAATLTFTVGAIVFLILALASVIVAPIVFQLAYLGYALKLGISLARWPILLLVIMLALAVLYRYGPSRKKPRWRWVTWGSGFAAVAWIVGCQRIRQLQRDLWLSRSRHRLHDLDVDFEYDRAPRRRDQRRDGAPDRERHDEGRRQTPGRTRCSDGRSGCLTAGA